METSITAMIEELADEDTLIITDSYGYPRLREYGRTIVVGDNHADQVRKIKGENVYSKVIAVGGCTALDIGRACAVGRELVNIPTILSTSCISVDRSVLNYAGQNIGEKTAAPSQVIVCLPSLLETSFEELEQWSSSGFGDLFSNISASIDFQYRAGELSLDRIAANAPDAFEALEWVRTSFTGYGRDCLTKLAMYSHNSSVDVIKRGDTELSAAGEHKLDYKLRELYHDYTEKRPTHGQSVSVGTLLSAMIFGEQNSEYTLYDSLRGAYQKLGLPTSYDDLRKIGIERGHLVGGLKGIQQTGTYLGDYFASGDYSLLDRVFGGVGK